MKTFDRIPLLVTIKTDQTILNGSILLGFKIKRNFWLGVGIDRRICWRNVRGIRDHDCLISSLSPGSWESQVQNDRDKLWVVECIVNYDTGNWSYFSELCQHNLLWRHGVRHLLTSFVNLTEFFVCNAVHKCIENGCTNLCSHHSIYIA